MDDRSKNSKNSKNGKGRAEGDAALDAIARQDVSDEGLVEDVSIDGICGVY